MAVTNFNTSNQTFRKLMGNGLVYRVPTFQRDYSWSEEEWDDLWRDITGMMEPGGERGHYLGYLVLQSDDERRYDIIDGQQRMTTLCLLLLAVLSNLRRLVSLNIDADDNNRRIEELRKTFIGYLDPVTLIPQSKLTLNRHNDKFYQNYLVPLERLPKRNLKASEHLLRKGFEWLDERVAEQFGSEKNGAELARFVDTIADRIFFTVISVTDELNAFVVFETLNARGVRLSSTDLLKNYLFSIVHSAGGDEHEMRALEERWETIVGKLGSESVPDFLRVFWNSQNPLTRHSELFKTIRGTIKDKKDVFELLRNMDQDADIYSALGDPGDPTWTSAQSEYVSELGMFNVSQPFALLLRAKMALSDADFTRVVRACSIISFRYNVIGKLNPNDQERVYNSVAVKIAKGELNNAGDIIRALRDIYTSDERFRSAFEEKEIKTTSSRNKQIVRYILFQVEKHHSNNDFDSNSDKYNIEHILPEHPADNWEVFKDEQIERYTYRIGNMTLLTTGPNRAMGNSPYDKKKTIYEQSEFGITKKVAEDNSEWTSERIASRQKWLAKQATAIWRIAELEPKRI
ncbi:MAG: DUF262 domain-containing protein [Nitrospirae bacterium]|nr:DUF262 domain-containing protein [Nitrospirota bacterium]